MVPVGNKQKTELSSLKRVQTMLMRKKSFEHLKKLILNFWVDLQSIHFSPDFISEIMKLTNSVA